MKKLGFGFMRLPLHDPDDWTSVDFDMTDEMVDTFLERGFSYFDTARPYHGGMSEVAIGRCLSARHPRESFQLTDKLTFKFGKTPFVRGAKDIQSFFDAQLEACQVDYFDIMNDFKPLDASEYAALESVVEVLSRVDSIPCTSCGYCLEGCPKGIKIPRCFAYYNMDLQYRQDTFFSPQNLFYVNEVEEGHRASDCIKCGKCEVACPQHLPVPKLMEKVAARMEG